MSKRLKLVFMLSYESTGKENFMAKPSKDSDQSKKKPQSPLADDMIKEKQRQKAEVQEVAGRHKNEGQKGHKGRR